jgi:hypothetical protein
MLWPLYPANGLVPIVQDAGWVLRLTWMAWKVTPPPGFNTCTIQPTARLYTNYAIPATGKQVYNTKYTVQVRQEKCRMLFKTTVFISKHEEGMI